MAVVAVTFDGTRLSGAESESDSGVWDRFDASQSPTQEDNFVFQGDFSISNKVGTSEGGIEFEDDGTTDLTTTPQVLLFKINAITYGIMEREGSTGGICLVGSGTTTDRYRFNVFGFNTYPPIGGWQFVPIDAGMVEYRDLTEGTPVITAADYYAFVSSHSAASRSENIAMDALDRIGYGEGLTLVGGDTAPAGTLSDFITEDEDTVDNRWGVVHVLEDFLTVVIGFLNIGSATTTVFTDSDRSLVSPDAKVDEGFFGMQIDVQNASSVINLTDYTWASKGKDNKKIWFDTEDEIIDLINPNSGTGNVLQAWRVEVSGPTFTDITAEFSDTSDADTTFFPASESNGDYVAFGMNDTFTTMTFDNANGQEGGNGAVTWEFFDRDTDDWVGLSGVTDNTSSFTATPADGLTVTWTEPTTWTKVSLNGEEPLYYIRARITSVYNLAPGNPIHDQGFVQEPDHILSVGHSFLSGQTFLYNDEGGSEASLGLTDLTQYFVHRLDDDNFSVHTTKIGSETGSVRVNLTPSTSGNGEQHSFRRDTDTRTTLTGTGTSGSSTLDGWKFERWRLITLTSAFTISNSKFNECSSITLSTATLDTCTSTRPLLAEGESFITVSTLANISDCIFISGDDGHAIDIDTTGTYAYADNTHTGYWSPAETGWNFATTSGVNGTTEVITTDALHGFTTGDAVYYNDEGGAVSIGLTDGVRYYVNVISTTTVSMHVTKQDSVADTNRIDLTASGSETHSLYSSNAAIHNSTTSGTVTIGVSGGNAPSIRNTSGATTVVNNAVTIGVSGVTEGTSCKIIADETNGTITEGDVLMEAFADSTGNAELTTFNYESGFDPSGLDVIVRTRNQGLCVAAIAEDTPAFVDETDEAASVSTNDMTLLPTVPATSDAYYFGHTEQFIQFKINITTALTQSSPPTFAFEYWNGAWVALSGLVDGTNGYETSGENIISFTLPGDWITVSVNSQGPFYYVRIRITATGTITQIPIAQTATIDATRFLPYAEERVITSTGLADIASWQEDTISKFTPD